MEPPNTKHEHTHRHRTRVARQVYNKGILRDLLDAPLQFLLSQVESLLKLLRAKPPPQGPKNNHGTRTRAELSRPDQPRKRLSPLTAWCVRRFCVEKLFNCFTYNATTDRPCRKSRQLHIRHNVYVRQLYVFGCVRVAGGLEPHAPSRRHSVRLLARPCACLGHGQ